MSVVVDDFIPVGQDNKPVFNHSSNRGEVWPCLLEKAYAKLQVRLHFLMNELTPKLFQGSYHHLEAGRTMSSMVDLSSGFPELIHDEKWGPLSNLNQNLFTNLNRIFNNKYNSIYSYLA